MSIDSRLSHPDRVALDAHHAAWATSAHILLFGSRRKTFTAPSTEELQSKGLANVVSEFLASAREEVRSADEVRGAAGGGTASNVGPSAARVAVVLPPKWRYSCRSAHLSCARALPCATGRLLGLPHRPHAVLHDARRRQPRGAASASPPLDPSHAAAGDAIHPSVASLSHPRPVPTPSVPLSPQLQAIRDRSAPRHPLISTMSVPEVFYRLSMESLVMFRQDLSNIRAGNYNLPYDMDRRHRQFRTRFVLNKAATYLNESSRVLERRNTAEPDKVWMSSNLIPEYYQSTWHYQSDGWLSSGSARACAPPAPAPARSPLH